MHSIFVKACLCYIWISMDDGFLVMNEVGMGWIDVFVRCLMKKKCDLERVRCSSFMSRN